MLMLVDQSIVTLMTALSFQLAYCLFYIDEVYFIVLGRTVPSDRKVDIISSQGQIVITWSDVAKNFGLSNLIKSS